MNLSMEFSRKLALAYGAMCKPLCQTLKLPQTAFDILLFLANNRLIRRRQTSWRSAKSRPIWCRSTWTSWCGTAI